MSTPKRSHYIRIDLPPEATQEEIEGLGQAVVNVVEDYIDEYEYDIPVSGSAWDQPTEENQQV